MTGKEFRKWRRSNDITQAVIADISKVDISVISRWENDKAIINLAAYKLMMEYVDTYQ